MYIYDMVFLQYQWIASRLLNHRSRRERRGAERRGEARGDRQVGGSCGRTCRTQKVG